MNVQAWPLPVERLVDHPSISACEGIAREQSWLTGILRLLLGDTNGLDAVRQAAVAIDHFGFVLDASPSAEAMFDDSLYVRNRRLMISDPQSRSSLDALIRRLIAMPAVEAIPDVHPIVIRRVGKRPIIAKVLAVPAAARNLFLGARAILNLVPVEPKARPDRLASFEDVWTDLSRSKACSHALGRHKFERCRRGIEHLPTNCSKPVEDRVCEDRYASTKPTGRTRFAALVGSVSTPIFGR